MLLVCRSQFFHSINDFTALFKKKTSSRVLSMLLLCKSRFVHGKNDFTSLFSQKSCGANLLFVLFLFLVLCPESNKNRQWTTSL